jgi:hypothetical protein
MTVFRHFFGLKAPKTAKLSQNHGKNVELGLAEVKAASANVVDRSRIVMFEKIAITHNSLRMIMF